MVWKLLQTGCPSAVTMSVQQTAPGIHAALLSNIGLGCEVYVRWTGVDLHISVLLHPCAVALLSSQIIEPPSNTTTVMLDMCITTGNVLLHHTAGHCSDTGRVKPRHFLDDCCVMCHVNLRH